MGRDINCLTDTENKSCSCAFAGRCSHLGCNGCWCYSLQRGKCVFVNPVIWGCLYHCPHGSKGGHACSLWCSIRRRWWWWHICLEVPGLQFRKYTSKAGTGRREGQGNIFPLL